jgi:hypothetical protein
MIAYRRLVLTLPVIVGSALALNACSGEVSVGDKTLSSSDLEIEASRSLTKQFGQKPASIECPEDLKAEVGQTEVCSLEDSAGGTYDMTVKITSVDDDGNAKFDISVGDLKSVDTTS